MNCHDCEFFKRQKGNPRDPLYRESGKCSLPFTPDYIIVPENGDVKWCPRNDKAGCNT